MLEYATLLKCIPLCKLLELKSELAKNISNSSASGVIDNPGQIRELKRTIARVLTIMNEK